MGLEEVGKEVLRKANLEVERIRKEAEKEAAEIMKKAQQKVQDYRKKVEEEIKRKLEVIKTRELTQSNLDVRNQILNSKKEAIESAFDKALKRLIDSPKDRNEAILGKLLEKAQSEIQISKIHCNKKDREFVSDNQYVEMQDYGLMAENEDTTIRVDYTFKTLLQQLKEEKLAEVAKQLID